MLSLRIFKHLCVLISVLYFWRPYYTEGI